MPVADHPVHERTIQKAGTRYGCYNRQPLKPSYLAPDGFGLGTLRHTREVKVVAIKHAMTTDCQHRVPDPMCGDCKWKQSDQ